MFFCKEKCGSIFAMKKFILALVLVVMVGMDAGVVFAVNKYDDAFGGDSNASDEYQIECSDGQAIVGDKCEDIGTTPKIDCEKDGGSWVNNDCVTKKEFCWNQGQVLDEKSGSCKTIEEIMTEYCKSKDLEYDPGVGKCY